MAEERRIDPSDSKPYSFDEISEFYRGTYKASAIMQYWMNECTPAPAAGGRRSKAARAAAAAAAAAQEDVPPARPKAKGRSKAATAAAAPVGQAQAPAPAAQAAAQQPAPKGRAKAKGKDKAKAKAKARTGPANPKRFINEEATIVQDALDGLIWSTPSLARLDGYPDIKVVFRTDWDKDKVAIISGGGAGHEPMHGGFVGKGMLTAAVSGETFASPSIDAVLAAIVQVTGSKGCLLVIKNYTGDRLNFSQAAQRARVQYGLEVETVITKDDVATSAERGIAGTLFVHKVAGALSEQGKSLAEIKAAAEEVIQNTASMGVSFSSVRRLKPEMIPLRRMEVGLGIHGEPGASTEDMTTATGVVEVILNGILASERMKAEAPHGFCCMVNDLGNVPPQEMCIVVAALMKSKWADKIKLLCGPGPLCTSLDMNGVSLSLLRLTPEIEAQLKAETSVAAWPQVVVPEFPEPVKGVSLKDPMEGVKPSDDPAVSSAIEKACKALIDAKSMLDTLDSKVGDADCGTTMASAAGKVLEAKGKLPLADPKATCTCLSDICGKVMGGSSGVLLSIMFLGMAGHFEAASDKTWTTEGPNAFMAGLQAMMKAGGANKGSRTMLDALVPAAEALQGGKGLGGAKEAAEAGVESTKEMAPRAGRSENVPESVWRGVEDPGAKAVATVFAALAG